MICIEVVGGIKAEPLVIKTESSNKNETNIVEIRKEDIQTEAEEEVEENIKLEDISIKDIQEDGVDINRETDSRSKPGEGNSKLPENYMSNNTEMDFQDTEEARKKETDKKSRLKPKKIVHETFLLNYEDDLQSVKKKYKRKQKKIKKPVETSSKNSPPEEINKLFPVKKFSRHNVGYDDYTVTKNQQYHCNSCQFQTTNKRAIFVHVRNNHTDKDVFSSIEEEDLKTTLKIRTESDNINRFISWYEYKLDCDNKYRCNHCQVVIQSENEMFIHIHQNHRTLKMNQCPHCSYQSKYDLSRHIITVHTAEEDIHYIRCDICECQFKVRSDFRLHMRQHLEPVGMKPCLQCPKVFKTTHQLTRHIHSVHKRTSRKKLTCFHCQYQCDTKLHMEHHLQSRHTNIEALEILQCELCPYKTKFKASMQRHIETKHNHVFQCHICSYKCTQKIIMDLHLIGHKKKKDEDDLKYRCNKCDYRTHRLYNLKVHKLSHLKPEEIEYFYCYHCDFKAKRKDNLKSHIFRHQKKEELPFQCFICDFTAKNKNQLIRHVDMHSKNAKEDKAPKIDVIPPSRSSEKL